MKIRGNTVGTPMPRADWSQNNENKADFIKNRPIKHIKGEGVEGAEYNYITELERGIYTIEGRLYYHDWTMRCEIFDETDLVFVERNEDDGVTLFKVTTDALYDSYKYDGGLVKGANNGNSGIRVVKVYKDWNTQAYQYEVKTILFDDIRTDFPEHDYNEETALYDYPSWYGVNDFVNTAIETALANFVNVGVNGQ